MTTIKEVITHLESLAPPVYQESYDNSGLIVGRSNQAVKGVLVSLDSTEAIVDEAIARDCNLIIAHHPIVFGGIKKLNGKNYVERTVIKAIKNDIAIYAIHTNLDNVQLGVNNKIADILGLEKRKILIPKTETLYKLSFFCPNDQGELIVKALHEAGAGQIGNYDYCSYTSSGEGAFRPLDGSNPHLGSKGNIHKEPELSIEMIIKDHLRAKVIDKLKEVHPYEEVAYFIHPISNENQEIGTGMIGELAAPVKTEDFLKFIKNKMQTDCIRHTKIINSSIQKVAVVGGSGSFALKSAIRNGADIFITGDFKYHEFFDAEDHLMIADIGHYESEQFTISLLVEYLTKKFPNFAILFTEINTNPINYF